MADTTPTPGVLSEMTIDDVEQLDPEVVVMGIASTEPHGPHLPYGTDTYQADALCRKAVEKANSAGASVLMYPTLPIGNNVNFKAFPFACRIGVNTLMNVVLDIIEAIEEEGVRKIVFVNGHGGNTRTLKATLREHRGRHAPGDGAFVCLTGPGTGSPPMAEPVIEFPSSHAGESETSRMLHLRPDLVNADAFDEFPINEPTIAHLREGHGEFVPRWDAHMPESAGGETRASSAEKGEALIEASADWIAELLVDLAETPMHAHFPFPEEE